MNGNDNPLFWKPSKKRFLLEIAGMMFVLSLFLFPGKDKNNDYIQNEKVNHTVIAESKAHLPKKVADETNKQTYPAK
tara:strand:+ start:821 stop:1051 length:231 start_codon:yes stop_codon:yes gene_type:complete